MKLLNLSLILIFGCFIIVKSQRVSDYAALDTFIRDAFSGLAISDSKFKEISPVVQGAIDFVSSNDPRQLSDQQRGIQIVQLLKYIDENRGNKQLLKNLIGRIFGCVWRSSTVEERSAFAEQVKNFVAVAPPSRKRRLAPKWFDFIFNHFYLLDGASTLMFAIDSTSSMNRDFPVIKDIAQGISEQGSRAHPVDYILSDINDPVEKLRPTIVRPATSAGLERFIYDIKDINLTNGGDCPELAFTGMLRGFNSFPNTGSNLFVFTNAVPKDATVDNMANLMSFAKKFDTRISFFVAKHPLCERAPPDYAKLKEVASKTGGFVFPLEDPKLPTPAGRKRRSAGASDRLPFITSELEAHTTIYQGNGISTSGKLVVFNIDDEIKFLTIKFQADANHEQIQLFNERFQQITTRDILGNVVLYQFDHQLSGSYFMLVPRAAGSFRYTVSAAFKNPIVVNTKYFIDDGPASRPIPYPVLGIQNKILISVTGHNRVTRNTITANIIQRDGTKIAITLSPDSGTGAFEGSFIPPISEYKIQIQGKTIGGKQFARLTSNFVQAKSTAFVTIYAGEENSVRYNTKATVFLIAYKSPGSPFAGKVETSLSTSKINNVEFANISLGSTKNFVELVYTSPAAPDANRQTDEITIRDHVSKDILHRIPILLF